MVSVSEKKFSPVLKLIGGALDVWHNTILMCNAEFHGVSVSKSHQSYTECEGTPQLFYQVLEIIVRLYS